MTTSKPIVQRRRDIKRVLHETPFSQDLYLIDPSAQSIDYGAGTMDRKVIEKLLKVQRNGRGLQRYPKRQRSVGKWLNDNDPGAVMGLIGILVVLGLISTTVERADSWAFFCWEVAAVAALITTIIVTSALTAPHVNRRIDALDQMLETVEVSVPSPSNINYHDPDHDPEAKRKDALLSSLGYKLVSLREGWGTVRRNRKVSREQKAEMATEMDLVLYGIARVMKDPTPELGEAVQSRAAALIAKFEEIITPPARPAFAIEAPKQDRSDDQLIRDLTGFAEPETVEYEANPAITAYPHAREIR